MQSLGYTNTQRPSRVAVWLVAVAAIIGSGWVFSSVRDDFNAFVVRQNAAYFQAKATADAAIAQFTHSENAITVQIYNPTGGTASFYVGMAGAKVEAAQGVDVDRPPELVSTLGPHQQGTIYVNDWIGKYISTLTTYLFLNVERPPATLFAQLSYAQTGVGYTTVVKAVPNLSDSNYLPVYPNMVDDISAMQVQQTQYRAVVAATKANDVDREAYKTNFLWYVGSALRRLGFS